MPIEGPFIRQSRRPFIIGGGGRHKDEGERPYLDAHATQSPLDTTPSGRAEYQKEQGLRAGAAAPASLDPLTGRPEGQAAPAAAPTTGSNYVDQMFAGTKHAAPAAQPAATLDPYRVGEQGVRTGNEILSPYGTASVGAPGEAEKTYVENLKKNPTNRFGTPEKQPLTSYA